MDPFTVLFNVFKRNESVTVDDHFIYLMNGTKLNRSAKCVSNDKEYTLFGISVVCF